MVPLNISMLRNSGFWPDISFRRQLADRTGMALGLLIIILLNTGTEKQRTENQYASITILGFTIFQFDNLLIRYFLTHRTKLWLISYQMTL